MGVGEIINGMSELAIDDGGANYILLHEGLSFVDKVVSLIVGFLVCILIVGIPLIVSLEVLYINMRFVRLKCDEISKKNKKMDKLVGLCFRDARAALYQANTIQTGKSANMIYLGLKIKAILLAFIVIGLALGPINTVIEILTKWVKMTLAMFI